MSRIINYSSAVTLTPTGYTTAGSYTFTHQTVANAYTDANSTTSNRMTLASSSRNTRKSQLYYNFDTSLLSQIPSNAAINSVAANVKYYVNDTTYVTAVSIRLYSNTTAKGSAVTNRPTSATKYSITTGSWTRSELQNARLYVSATHSAGNSSAYLYFFGADLTVNYTVNGVEYEITATSEYNGASVSPSSQFILPGEDAVVRIDTDTLDNMVLEDNGNNVIESLQYINQPIQGTATSVPTATFSTGGTDSAQLYMSSTSTGTDWLEQAIGHSAENPNTTNTGNTYCKGPNSSQNASGWIIYNFDFSEIPEDAVIDSTEVKVYGSRENYTNDTTHRARVELYSGDSVKGSYYDLTSTNYSIVTIPTANTGTWTRAELQQAKLRFSVAYYGGRVNGITWNVNYHVDTPPHYEYTISNVNADHDIVFKQSIIVPPEEDPQKQYFSLTISSINATTDPVRGTIRVESGSTETIKIYPTDPLLTLTTDNGTNISGQLVYHAGGQPTYEVSTAQGASYGFNLNTGTGYYTSQNTGVDKSAAVSKIDFDFPVSCLVTFQFINYAETTYDFGVFGNIDTTLSNNYYAAGSNGATISDSNYRLACNTSTYNTSSVQTLTYEIPAGQHYIYIKYSKDDASADNNDSLQWKISNIEPLSPVSDAYYEYTLSNINQNHSLIFIFGDVTYYFVTSTHDGNGKLYPDGQTVCLPGDTYQLTIVPETPEDTVTVSDNNSDVTNSLQRKEVVTEKNGQSALTVNYVYTITNVQTAHTISVHDSSVVRYPINASSTYTGATVSPLYQSIEEGTNATINIQVNNLYEIKVKDNGTDVTSSLVAGDGRCTYTINNVQSAHTVVVEEATNYTVSTSSSYAGVTATANPTKVYSGRTCTVTITGASKDTMVVKDNNVDVTSSLVGSNNSYTYTLSNVSASHTITVTPITYTVTASSNFGSATITPASSTVIKGNSVTLTINAANTYSIRVTDNGTNVTGNLTGSANNYKYTISNVQAAHTVVVSEATYYNIYTANTYAGASISVPSKVYAGQSVTANVTVGNTYEIVFKDNGVTKSLAGASSPFTYTLTNVSSAHTFSIEEATYYTITTSSSYAGVTISANPSKVYAGRSTTITISGKNKDTMIVKDNGTNVTSSLAGSNNSYTYTLSNVSASHTITVEPITYAVNASSTFNGVSVTPTSSTVIKGNSVTLTINSPNTYSLKVTDNGTVVTGNLTGSANNYKYTISNVQAEHTIVVAEANKYTISTSSTYPGVTITANPTTVYEGQSSTITVTGAALTHMIIRDNGTIVTNSFTGSNNSYSYTLTNITTGHTFVASPSATYNITASSTYSRTTITPTSSTVIEGDSITFTITGDTTAIKVTDNNVDVTSSLVTNGTSKTYTISNITAAHTVTVAFAQTAFIKTSSGQLAGKKFYKKTGASTWTEMTLSEFQTYMNSNTVFFE